MEAWDDEQLVRPISVAENQSVAPDGDRSSTTAPDGAPRRTWLPLALSGTAIVLVIGAVSVFGALQFDDPASQDPAVFASDPGDEASAQALTTLPPRLDEILPALKSRLLLVALFEDGIRSLIWDPSFRIPQPYDLPAIAPMGTDSVEAQFDSEGAFVAISVRTPVGTDVYIGSPTKVSDQPGMVGASSFTWHAAESGKIAWITNVAGGVEIHTGTVDPVSGSLINDLFVAGIDGNASIVRWDANGFLVNSLVDDNMSIVALSPNGSPLWTRPGIAASASRSIAVTIESIDSTHLSRWVIINRFSGDPVSPAIDRPPEDVWVTTSRATDLTATVATFGRRTSLTINGPSITARRIIQIDTPVSPIGFAADSEYFLFDTLAGNDLIFVNWRTGASHTVPIPDAYELIGIDIG